LAHELASQELSLKESGEKEPENARLDGGRKSPIVSCLSCFQTGNPYSLRETEKARKLPQTWKPVGFDCIPPSCLRVIAYYLKEQLDGSNIQSQTRVVNNILRVSSGFEEAEKQAIS
jgi:hypothetical protein